MSLKATQAEQGLEQLNDVQLLSEAPQKKTAKADSPRDQFVGMVERLPVQMQTSALKPAPPLQFKSNAKTTGVHKAAAEGITAPSGKLPYLDTIQNSFGAHDVSSVQSHVGGAAAKANEAMGSQAYATGNHVAFKNSPDLHTAAHEAAHVVQQRAGVSLKGGVGQVGDKYERHADAVADAVVQGKSAEGILSQMAPGAAGAASVQHLPVQHSMASAWEATKEFFGYGPKAKADKLISGYFNHISGHETSALRSANAFSNYFTSGQAGQEAKAIRADSERSKHAVNLSDEELAGVVGYTGPAYRHMNQHLRGAISEKPARWEQTSAGKKGESFPMDRWNSAWVPIINKWNAFATQGLEKLGGKADSMLYRGIAFYAADNPKKYKDMYKKGSTVQEQAFMSTSTDLGQSIDWSKGPFGGMLIQIDNGAIVPDINLLSIYPGEEERLFPPGSQFIVKEDPSVMQTYEKGGKKDLELLATPLQQAPV